MRRCTICKKSSDEIKLYNGIFEVDMVMICAECAETEGVPIIQKPSESQLNKANERYSVRERMERMSGMRNVTEISEEQTITHGNLAKLRIPPKKEYHEDVLENYYWTLNIARRRAKLTIGQLSEKIQVEQEIIQGIEKGKIPENFEEIFIKIESILDIKLLKNHKRKINFVRTVDEEKEVLESVREKLDLTGKKQEQLDKLSKGEVDFSKREDLSNVTLNDLADMKKTRESRIIKRKAKEKEDEILGDDIDLDLGKL